MESSSMTNKIILALLLLLSATSAFAAEVKVLYVDRQADPFYAPRQSYGAIYDVTRQSAVSGAELGVKDAQIIGRAIETTFQLNRLTIAAGDSAVARLSDRLKTERDAAVILDLPGSDIEAIALQVGGTALFNIRDRSDELRVKTCKTNLFHVVPSDAMISDALAQYLKLMRWNTILVLTGDAAQDDVLLVVRARR